MSISPPKNPDSAGFPIPALVSLQILRVRDAMIIGSAVRMMIQGMFFVWNNVRFLSCILTGYSRIVLLEAPLLW